VESLIDFGVPSRLTKSEHCNELYRTRACAYHLSVPGAETARFLADGCSSDCWNFACSPDQGEVRLSYLWPSFDDTIILFFNCMPPVDSCIDRAFPTLTRTHRFHAVYCVRSEGHSKTIRARNYSSHTSLVPGHSLAGIAKNGVRSNYRSIVPV
jgi:hypothetical protein